MARRRPDAERVVVDGEEMTGVPEAELTRFRRQRIGFVFQQYNLLPTLTVAQNTTLLLKLAGRRVPRGPPGDQGAGRTRTGRPGAEVRRVRRARGRYGIGARHLRHGRRRFTGMATAMLYTQAVESDAIKASGLTKSVEDKNLETLNLVVVGVVVVFSCVVLINSLYRHLLPGP